jgi:hypothetical protein
MYYIYLVQSKSNTKKYIGSTCRDIDNDNIEKIINRINKHYNLGVCIFHILEKCNTLIDVNESKDKFLKLYTNCVNLYKPNTIKPEIYSNTTNIKPEIYSNREINKLNQFIIVWI